MAKLLNKMLVTLLCIYIFEVLNCYKFNYRKHRQISHWLQLAPPSLQILGLNYLIQLRKVLNLLMTQTVFKYYLSGFWWRGPNSRFYSNKSMRWGGSVSLSSKMAIYFVTYFITGCTCNLFCIWILRHVTNYFKCNY